MLNVGYNNAGLYSKDFHNQNSFKKQNVQSLSFKSNFTISAMAPLLVKDELSTMESSLNNKDSQAWKAFEKDLDIAKENGVKSISVDVWWGEVEKNGDNKWNWAYYDKMFETVRKHDLNIVPIISLHKCGGNVGDDVNVPIPSWALNKVAKKAHVSSNDVTYKNEHGDRLNDTIPLWFDKEILKDYKEVMVAFKKRYIKKYKDNIDEINISLGPAGELRYPTYGPSIPGAEYPNRGWFVGYSKAGIKSFQEYAKKISGNDIKKLNEKWGTELKNFDEVMPPNDNHEHDGKASEFVKTKAYDQTTYGKDFIQWYHGSLINHGELILETANNVFRGTNIPLGFKIPGVHWQAGNPERPRISEIIAGLLPTNVEYCEAKTDFGYSSIMTMAKTINNKFSSIFNPKQKLITHFTCLEMTDNNAPPAYSKASTLVNYVLNAAKNKGLTIKGENALNEGLAYSNTYDTILHNANPKSKRGYDGITFLRVGDITQDGGEYLKRFSASV